MSRQSGAGPRASRWSGSRTSARPLRGRNVTRRESAFLHNEIQVAERAFLNVVEGDVGFQVGVEDGMAVGVVAAVALVGVDVDVLHEAHGVGSPTCVALTAAGPEHDPGVLHARQ